MKFSEMEKLYISISISFVMRNVPLFSEGSISRANPSCPRPSSVHQGFSICGLPLPAYKLYTDTVGHFFCSSAQIATDVVSTSLRSILFSPIFLYLIHQVYNEFRMFLCNAFCVGFLEKIRL